MAQMHGRTRICSSLMRRLHRQQWQDVLQTLFSATGQLWGNPLYNWEYHKKTGYNWWILRMTHCMKLYDKVRIDHFRGFDEYWSVPYGDETAENGKWEKRSWNRIVRGSGGEN